MFVLGQTSKRKKSTAEVAKLAQSAKALQAIFDHVEPMIAPGASPNELREEIIKKGRLLGTHIGLNQIGFCRHGYIHPPVDDNTPLGSDEVFTLDIWISYKGWYADLARPYLLSASSKNLRLYQAALACQKVAIATVQAGQTYLSLVEAVQKVAEEYGCYIIDEACGHGIGRRLHEEPTVSFTYASNNLFQTIPQDLVLTLEVALSLTPTRLIHDAHGYSQSENGQTILYAEAMIVTKAGKSELLGR